MDYLPRNIRSSGPDVDVAGHDGGVGDDQVTSEPPGDHSNSEG